MIRAVLFDLDGTLYDRDAAMVELARDQFAAFSSRMPGIDEARFFERLAALDEHGYASRSDLYLRLAEEFGFDNALAVDLERHFWESYSRRCEVTDDTWTTLRTLKSSGKKLGVITNGQTTWQRTKLEGLGLGEVFDVVMVSEAEGIRKPDARIFHRGAERCGVTPAEAMFVGDHPDIDVAGARAAGMFAVWKRVPYWTLTTGDVPIIDRLSEILQLHHRDER